MAIDPVCGMEVDEKTAQYVSQYKGKTWFFCADGCKKAFDENPEKYAGGGKRYLNERTSSSSLRNSNRETEH